ncbi:hypothetical protein GQ457_07G021750 [Hibiscus cannabinus]
MKFAVKAWSNRTARAGVLHLGNVAAAIDTPSLLISTRKGLPLFIPPDLLSSLPFPDSRLLHVSPIHFFQGLSIKTISKIGGLHQLLGLHDYGFAAFPRDSIQCLPEATSTNKTGASFDNPCGRLLIKPAEYMEMISSMKPELWVTLADEVPAWVSDKRNKTSVDRTIKWLDECIALSPASGAVFGAIVGGSSLEERRRCALEVAMRNVSGYWIGGFGLAESMDVRPALLNAVTEPLPEEKPRLICGLELPEEILQGVAAGVDLFESTYIYHLTLEGFALTFPLDRTQINASNLAPSDVGSDPRKINLRATVFRCVYEDTSLQRPSKKDATPIVEGCTCYTCRNHTRAYINHLLNVHEMLAQILLEIHNTHHFLGFFRLIREAITADRFEEFCKDFVGSRYDHLVEDGSERACL